MAEDFASSAPADPAASFRHDPGFQQALEGGQGWGAQQRAAPRRSPQHSRQPTPSRPPPKISTRASTTTPPALYRSRPMLAATTSPTPGWMTPPSWLWPWAPGV